MKTMILPNQMIMKCWLSKNKLKKINQNNKTRTHRTNNRIYNLYKISLFLKINKSAVNFNQIFK